MIHPTNPGNVRFYSGFSGLAGEKNGFAIFKNEGYGYKAIYSIVSTYLTKYGLNTISKIGARYAPAAENNTNTWVNIVSQVSGIGPNQIVNSSDFYRIIAGIVRIENGIRISPLEVQEKINSADSSNFWLIGFLSVIFGTFFFVSGKTKI
jgi:hypothetical protein